MGGAGKTTRSLLSSFLHSLLLLAKWIFIDDPVFFFVVVAAADAVPTVGLLVASLTACTRN